MSLCPTCSLPQRPEAPIHCTCIALEDRHPGSPLSREQAREAVKAAIPVQSAEGQGIEVMASESGELFLIRHRMRAYGRDKAVMWS
jgi:hypothetical protein